MAEGPLQPALDRFGRIDPAHFVAATLLEAKRTRSPAQLQSSLRKWAAGPLVQAALRDGKARGHLWVDEERVELTDEGRAAAREALGDDADEPRDKLIERRFPVLALGLDPDDPDVRRKLASHHDLVGAIVAIGFGLPGTATLSLKHTCTELIWRTLRANLPGVVGSGPFPMVEESDVVGSTILAGLAGVAGAAPSQALKHLAGQALMIASSQVEVMRLRLVQIGLIHGIDASPLAAAPLTDDEGFAERVRQTAAALETPPFRGRVAIAQVYDAFGADCGSLASFKERLAEGARQRRIDLSSLDVPEYMEPELRDRSVTAWGEDRMHFVVSEWK